MSSPLPSPAIILAAFGASDPAALKALFHIRDRVAAAWPGAEIRLAFTSRVLRNLWQRRAGEAAFRAENQGLPEDIYAIRSPLALLAEIQEAAPRPILVQSLHVAEGEEYTDLRNMIEALSGLKTIRPEHHPFPGLILGPPALGDGGPGFLGPAARALQPLTERASQADAALVLMGHGSRRLALESYGGLETRLRRDYPPTYVGLVEGGPEEILAALAGPRPVLLAPLLTVAGEHARRDLAGPGQGSWADRFRAAGHEVMVHIEGLGALETWAGLYVEHVRRGLAALEAFSPASSGAAA
jgi:sirohydrochlorin cobaltochelatase